VLVSLDDLPGNLETTWISFGLWAKGSETVNRKSEKVEERCWCSSNKEIIKISSRQHEHTSQCDGPAWLRRERCEFLVSIH
jgi:hypothetical protein